MNSDIRLALNFFDHPKTIKLRRRLGLDGVICLLRLWCFAASYRCSGELSDMDIEEIAIAAGWPNDSLTFVTTLVDVRWLDVDSAGVHHLHNWVMRNGWASSSDQRSDKSRFSRMAKTHPDLYKTLYDSGVRAITANDYKTATTSFKPTIVNEPLNESLTECSSPLPSPSPSPSPLPIPSLTAATASKIFFQEFRSRYRQLFGVEVPGGMNGSVNEICSTYSREAIEYAFEKAVTRIPKPRSPFTYMKSVLEGQADTGSGPPKFDPNGTYEVGTFFYDLQQDHLKSKGVAL